MKCLDECLHSQEGVIVFFLFFGLVGLAVLQFGSELVAWWSILPLHNTGKCPLQIGHKLFPWVKEKGMCLLPLHTEFHLSLSS